MWMEDEGRRFDWEDLSRFMDARDEMVRAIARACDIPPQVFLDEDHAPPRSTHDDVDLTDAERATWRGIVRAES